MKNAAAKAFYEYFHNSDVMKELQYYSRAHLVAIIQNVGNQTRKLSADGYAETMLNAGTEYRWCFFDFMLKTLIRLRQDKKLYQSNLDYWPGLKTFEALPALGWAAYKKLVTDSYGCNSMLDMTRFPMGADCKVVFDANGPKEVIFWQRIDWQIGYYMERVPLERIGAAPTTIGEEIQALAAWLKKAGKALEVCGSRDYDTFFTGPMELTTKKEPKSVYKKAKVRPASHDDAATGEVRRLEELMARVGDFAKRLTPAEQKLLKKYPEKVSGCLSPAM
jgi:hypothetical protein